MVFGQSDNVYMYVYLPRSFSLSARPWISPLRFADLLLLMDSKCFFLLPDSLCSESIQVTHINSGTYNVTQNFARIIPDIFSIYIKQLINTFYNLFSRLFFFLAKPPF